MGFGDDDDVGISTGSQEGSQLEMKVATTVPLYDPGFSLAPAPLGAGGGGGLGAGTCAPVPGALLMAGLLTCCCLSAVAALLLSRLWLCPGPAASLLAARTCTCCTLGVGLVSPLVPVCWGCCLLYPWLLPPPLPLPCLRWRAAG